jgi:hypothetical protein
MRVVRQARQANLSWRIVVPALGPAFVIACVGAVAEFLGYSLGAGDAYRGLMRFEREHASLYTAQDLQAVALRQSGSGGRA